ncbi:MAG TPA: hypothetical protein VFA58_07310 [Chthoniobacterales bacterium]|nr:hypothetical protein [Chthoniobacterales bacterium]
MKIFGRFVPVFVILIFSCLAFGDDFKSETLPGDGGVNATPLPRVHGNQLMLIRNFTQEDSSSGVRGVVQISKDSGATWVTVLSAAFVDTSGASPEIINNIVIAGPVDVRATCGGTSGQCFISFKKRDN